MHIVIQVVILYYFHLSRFMLTCVVLFKWIRNLKKYSNIAFAMVRKILVNSASLQYVIACQRSALLFCYKD